MARINMTLSLHNRPGKRGLHKSWARHLRKTSFWEKGPSPGVGEKPKKKKQLAICFKLQKLDRKKMRHLRRGEERADGKWRKLTEDRPITWGDLRNPFGEKLEHFRVAGTPQEGKAVGGERKGNGFEGSK